MSSKGRKKNAKKQTATPQYSISDLLAKAEELITTLQPELAEKFYIKALDLEPHNTQVLDAYGYLLLELEQFDKGKKLLEESIKLEPLTNPMKYLTYAQALQGQEAVAMYNKGIEMLIQQFLLLQNQIQQSSEEMPDAFEELIALKQQIVGGYCALAEIYLTDECFADNAETECERYLEAAIKFDPNNPEPYLTLASVRMSQQRNVDALEQIKKSYDLWKDVDPKDFENLPSYEYRHNTAKLFLELEQNATAAQIWESLLEEDDEIAEVHYFLGLAYRPLSSSIAKDSVARAKELLELSQCDDQQLVQEIDELVKLLAGENIEKLDNEAEMEDGDNEEHNNNDKSEMEL